MGWIMPTYDYRCEANGRTVEVRHGMNEEVRDWAALCALAGIEPGDTPGDAEVVRLISGGYVLRHGAGADPAPGCGSESCCGGVCGLD